MHPVCTLLRKDVMSETFWLGECPSSSPTLIVGLSVRFQVLVQDLTLCPDLSLSKASTLAD